MEMPRVSVHDAARHATPRMTADNQRILAPGDDGQQVPSDSLVAPPGAPVGVVAQGPAPHHRVRAEAGLSEGAAQAAQSFFRLRQQYMETRHRA